MNKFSRSQIIERIRSLMALGNLDSNTFTHEAAAAVRKAERLMDQYNIQLAEILEAGVDGLEDVIHRYIPMDGKANKYIVRGWRISLFQTLCKINMCKPFFSISAPVLIVVGRTLHVDIVEQMYYSLSNQIETLAIREAAKATARGEIRSNWPSPANTRTWKTSFMVGCTSTICEYILYEWEERQEDQQTNMRALVLYSDQQVNDYADEVLKPITRRKDYGPSHFNMDAYMDGVQAGENIRHRTGLQQKVEVPWYPLTNGS